MLEDGGNVGSQALLALALVEIDAATDGKGRVDAPRVDADIPGEVAGHFVVGGKVVGLAAHRPTGVERRKDELLVQVAQDIRDSGREIVVEQDGAGVEAVEPEAGWRADQRFEQEGLAVGECYRRRGGDLREQRAEPDVEAGLAQDGGDLGDVLQVELVARVAFRDQEKIARIRTDLLDRHHRRVHAKRQEGRVQVVEAAGEEVGVDRRQLEAGVAQVAR
jgi:hypothetical protein